MLFHSQDIKLTYSRALLPSQCFERRDLQAMLVEARSFHKDPMIDITSNPPKQLKLVGKRVGTRVLIRGKAWTSDRVLDWLVLPHNPNRAVKYISLLPELRKLFMRRY